MQSLYLPIKYAHLIFVTITIVLFNLRFWLRTMQPKKPLPVILRVLPHINDSMLLFTGMLMMQIVPWQPFGASKWLGVKLLLVLTYIFVGAFCLRATPRSGKWFGLYGAGMLIVLTIIYLAHWKPL